MWSCGQSFVPLAFLWKKLSTSILSGLTRRTNIFEGCCWFKFNSLGLALGMALQFYTSVGKGFKSKSQKVFGANSDVCRRYRGKTGRGIFCPPPLPILNRVKTYGKIQKNKKSSHAIWTIWKFLKTLIFLVRLKTAVRFPIVVT